MKVIQIIPSKYGGLDGWVNGKLKYSSNNNEIEIGRLHGHWCIENFSAGTIIAKTKEGKREVMVIGTSGTVESIPPSLKYAVVSNFQNIYKFLNLHWKEGLGITGSVVSILSALKTFGFLNYIKK